MDVLGWVAGGLRSLRQQMIDELGFADPLLVQPGPAGPELIRHAIRRQSFMLDGALIYDWSRVRGDQRMRMSLGGQLLELDGLRFAAISYPETYDGPDISDLLVVERSQHSRLYSLARNRTRREPSNRFPPPVLSAQQQALLWQNTVGFLRPSRLRNAKRYGVRPRRGLLLTGPPGNGKTSACRWIMGQCQKQRLECKVVSADDFGHARCRDEMSSLFELTRPGVIFFDDIDAALRDREKVPQSEAQSALLSGLDGMQISEGIVTVFTTNCRMEDIDQAFQRPGRLDVVIEFPKPAAELRRALIERWHPELRTHLNAEQFVARTAGLSFAEIDELKSLYVCRQLETGEWDMHAAIEQFRSGRDQIQDRRRAKVGFHAEVVQAPSLNLC